MHLRLIASSYDLRHAQTSNIILTGLFMLPDPKIMGIAVAISI